MVKELKNSKMVINIKVVLLMAFFKVMENIIGRKIILIIKDYLKMELDMEKVYGSRKEIDMKVFIKMIREMDREYLDG
jgi:hypothetical protein